VADSIRELIFQALERTLKTVPGIGEVRRGKIDPLEIQRYPAAFPFPGADTIIEQSLGDIMDRQMVVYTFLWIRTQNNIIKEIEAFLPRVQKILAADHQLGFGLGGPVKDFHETAVHETLYDEDSPDAAVIIESLCTYRVKRNDPYIQG
jgi:hypothetical protein